MAHFDTLHLIDEQIATAPRASLQPSLSSSEIASFKAPIPPSARPSRRPLMMAPDENVPTASTSSSSRLKRLSLVPGPSAYSPRDDTMSSPHAGPSTPRRTVGMRSSISYSPALASGRGSLDLDTPRSSQQRPFDGKVDERQAGRQGRGVSRRQEEGNVVQPAKKKGETLLEKHGELLQMIAQKERRVNELKEELAAQESSLAQLKARWTSLVSSGPQSSSHITRIRPNAASANTRLPSHPSHFMSVSSSASSDLSSVSSPSSSARPISPDPTDLPSLDQSIANLLANIPLPAGNEAIEGGKRFWDQLVKTVSAAAVGTVPESSLRATDRDDGPITSDEPRDLDVKALLDQAGPAFDLSSLKGIVSASLPWSPEPSTETRRPSRPSSSTRPTQPSPPLPANSARLPRGLSKSAGLPADATLLSPSISTASSTDLLSELDDEAGLSRKVLTPRKGDAASQPLDLTALTSRRSQSTMSESTSEDGWGW